MKKWIKGYLGLAMIICFVVMASGCTSTNTTPVKNKTFANGSLTFEYPGTWSDNKTFSYTQTGSEEYEKLGTLGNDTISLSVMKLNMSEVSGLESFTIEDVARQSYSNPPEGISLLSFNQSSYNNITFYELIYTSKDPLTTANTKITIIFRKGAHTV